MAQEKSHKQNNDNGNSQRRASWSLEPNATSQKRPGYSHKVQEGGGGEGGEGKQSWQFPATGWVLAQKLEQDKTPNIRAMGEDE